jgi:uracil-DNA glycosylase
MNSELSEIIEEAREQILFLQELGVGQLDAELPDLSVGKEVHSSKAEIDIPRERLERFVPTDEILKKISVAEVPQEDSKPKSRSGILESAKLSRLPSRPKPEPGRKPLPNKQGEEKMPEEIKFKDTLFGDIAETLPESNETIEEIRADIGDCTRCPLHKGRTKIVHSTGNFQADLMFVGEAPGADEDASGEPFVGRAGKLLDKIIEAIGMKREDVLIGNINRCRPPSNRQPTIVEAETCRPFLIREIAVVRPKVIVVLGNTACQNLLETKVGITKLRGNFQNYFGIKVMPTFHPAYLLRDPRKKREVWEDMKKVRDELEKS